MDLSSIIRSISGRALVAWLFLLTIVGVWSSAPQPHFPALSVLGQAAGVDASSSPDPTATLVKPGLVHRSAEGWGGPGPALAADGHVGTLVLTASTLWSQSIPMLPPQRGSRLQEPRAPPAV